MSIDSFYSEYGLWIVFGTVLLQQVGLPVPAFPLLILAGAQTLDDPAHGGWALVLSVVASSIGNYAWFVAGRRHGHRVLNAVCKVSLSPASCVRQAENAFQRYGAGTLVLGRFVPGLGIVAPPLAGGFGVGAPTFLLYNGAGSALWALSGLALGWAFHTEVEWLLEALSALGNRAAVVVALAVALYAAHRWWQRWRFRRALRAARIGVDELRELIERGDPPLVLDARSAVMRELDRRSTSRGSRAATAPRFWRLLCRVWALRCCRVICADGICRQVNSSRCCRSGRRLPTRCILSSRRAGGLRPSVRVLVDYLVAEVSRLLSDPLQNKNN